MATITLIGAGSVEFTRGLISDVVTSPELHGTTIALHDIDAERLSVAETLARRANETTGAGLAITATLDRREALDGADYVVNEIQVGGYAATLLDFEIPRSTACDRPSATRSASAASSGGCGRSRSWSASAATWRRSAPARCC